MENLQISKANAVAAYNEADELGKQLLANLFGSDVFSQKITDRVKSFEDACGVLNVKAENFLSKDDMIDEAAYKKLKVITKALNEGWTPDWENTDEQKWYPWFNMKAGFGFSLTFYVSWDTDANVGSRLCFRTSELAEYAGKQFIDVYKDFLT